MISSCRWWKTTGILAGLVLISAVTLAPPAAQAGTAVACVGVQANGYSVPSGVSADGRYALFTSTASNLIPGGATGWHLYVRDLPRCTTELVDATVTGGVPAMGIGGETYLSANGRYAAFSSNATDLLPGGTNGVSNVFLRDLRTRTTELISVTPDGGAANSASWPAGVSASGRHVLFVSAASNLLPDGPPPNARNVYLRDRELGSTRLVATVPPNSMAPGWYPSLSPDGRFSLVDLVPAAPAGESRWLTHLVNNKTLGSDLVSVPVAGDWPNSSTYGAGVSSSGRFVLVNSGASDLVAGDTNGASDVFVRDMSAGTTARISVSDTGAQVGGGSSGAGLSRDGRYATFWSRAGEFVAGDTNGVDDVFLRDTLAGTTTRVSVAGDGGQANAGSTNPKIGADGRFVLFWSYASNLVPGDTNGVPDAFLRDLLTGTTERVSVG